MHRNRILDIVLLLILLQAFIYAQKESSTDQSRLVPGDYQIAEKILLETDREIYMAGEIINISCFTYEPLLQKTLELSKIVYVEFFTSRNLIIDQIKIEMDESHGSGFIEIPKRLLSGKYYLRAYTNNMKNFGYEGFAYSSLTILNPFFEVEQKNEKEKLTSILKKCILHPEGGYIVSGHTNTVSCEFTNNLGNPVPCMARVLNNTNEVITTFITNEYGLGSFCFTPEPGNSYRVEATAGTEIIDQDIEISEKSISISKICQDTNKLVFKLNRYGNIGYPLFFEVVHSNSSIVIKKLSQNDSIINLPVNDLPKGIMKFQLRNSTNDILSTRNVFIPSKQNKLIQLRTNKSKYNSREKLELTVKNKLQNEIKGLLSMSVFLIDRENKQIYIESDKQEFLRSALYPLVGGTPYPAFEVIKDSLFLEQILMFSTNEEIFSENYPSLNFYNKEYFPEIENDLILGAITDESGKPVPLSPVIQTWIDTVSTMYTTTTNQDGLFFIATDRKGERELVVTNSKYATGNISLQKEFYPEFFSLAYEKMLINSSLRGALNQQMINLQINDSFHGNMENKEIKQVLPFYFAPDKIFLIDDYVALTTLKEFLYEVVPGILPSTSKGKTVIRIASIKTNVSFGDDPLYLIDGVPVFDADLVANLNCSDLVSVGVVYEKYFYQNETFDGIIDIHTRTGNASILELPESVYSVHFTGIQKTGNGNIYSIPDTNSHKPFFRTQLYWNPSLKMNENRDTRITFYTPDNAGDYLIRCSLKTPDGSVMYYYTTFRVDGE